MSEQHPPGLAPDVAALLPAIRDLVGPPAREVGLDEARRRFAELLSRGLAGAPDVPWTAARVETPTRELPARRPGLPFLALADRVWYTREYVPRGVDLGDPRISPREGDLTGPPPTVVVTAELDALRDSGRAYAGALRAAGSPVEHLEAAGQPHGFAHLVALAPSADATLTAALDRFAAVLHAAR